MYRKDKVPEFFSLIDEEAIIKITPNQDHRIHAAKLSKEANARKLKGEARLSWMLKKLKRDLRTDERQLRRILAKSRDGWIDLR